MDGSQCRVIPKANLHYLNSYNFRKGKPTFLDEVFDRLWWSPLVRIVPRWVSPNVLTIMGGISMLVLYYLIFTKIPKLDTTYSPRWLPLAAAGLLFSYVTFDGIDGKHARRLGVSSPLGQLMDHGIDAMVTGFYSYLSFVVFPGGYTRATMLNSISAIFHLFLIIWRESDLNFFSSSNGILGVTEANLLTVVIFLLRYYFGVDFFKKTIIKLPDWTHDILGDLIPRNLDFYTITVSLFVLGAYIELIFALVDLYKLTSNRSGFTFFTLACLIHSVPGAVIAYTLPPEMKVVGCIFAASIGSISAINNVICIVARTKLRLFHRGLIPHYIVMLHYFYTCFMEYHGLDLKILPIDFGYYELCFRVVAIYGLLYISFKFCRTTYEIKEYLNIPILAVGKAKGKHAKE